MHAKQEELMQTIATLRTGPIGKRVRARLAEFSSFASKHSDEWFSELCFCLLTANAKSLTACNVQKVLGARGFLRASEAELVRTLLEQKHRFHNTKARRIIEARVFRDVKKTVQQLVTETGVVGARAWLKQHVKGFGYKESSHFLRNVGYFDLAILDRHVLNIMKEHRMIRSIPKSLTLPHYLHIEKRFQQFAQDLGLSCAELDYYFWYMKAGDVLK